MWRSGRSVAGVPSRVQELLAASTQYSSSQGQDWEGEASDVADAGHFDAPMNEPWADDEWAPPLSKRPRVGIPAIQTKAGAVSSLAKASISGVGRVPKAPPSVEGTDFAFGTDELAHDFAEPESSSFGSSPIPKPSEFNVEVDKSDGTSLGIDVNKDLMIGSITPGGLIDLWNAEHIGGVQIEVGDKILEVNGQRGTDRKAEVVKKQVLDMVIQSGRGKGAKGSGKAARAKSAPQPKTGSPASPPKMGSVTCPPKAGSFASPPKIGSFILPAKPQSKVSGLAAQPKITSQSKLGKGGMPWRNVPDVSNAEIDDLSETDIGMAVTASKGGNLQDHDDFDDWNETEFASAAASSSSASWSSLIATGRRGGDTGGKGVKGLLGTSTSTAKGGKGKAKHSAPSWAVGKTEVVPPLNITEGMIVLYDGGTRGIVSTLYPSIDEYFVSDEETSQHVLDASHQIRSFNLAELTLTNEFRPGIDISDAVDVPGQVSVDAMKNALSDLSFECEVTLKRPEYIGNPWKIDIGPAQPTSVQSAMKTVQARLDRLLEAPVETSMPPKQMPSWLTEDEAADFAQNTQSPQKKSASAVEDPELEAFLKKQKEEFLRNRNKTMSEDGALDKAEPIVQDSPPDEPVELPEIEELAEPDEVTDQLAEDVGQPKASGKTVLDWAVNQHQFKGMPEMPANWIRVKSSSGRIYYMNTETGQATFQEPQTQHGILPEELPLASGWEERTSRSTGKTYYWHSASQRTQFDRPMQ